MGEFVGQPSTDAAIALLREGKVQECLDCLDKVTMAEPGNALAYSIMGAAYAKSGDRAMAIGSFERALSEEESTRAHANLAKAYEAVGRTRDAIHHYDRSLELDPTYQQSIEAMGRLGVEPGAGQQPAAHTPTLLGGDPAPTAGVTQVAVPTFAPPASTRAVPDLSDLERRAKENDAKIKASQKAMTKSGLIYGVIVGPVCVFASVFLCRMMPMTPGGILGIGILGVILGAIIGVYTGYTCCDEWDGAKAGAVIGAVIFGGLNLMNDFSIFSIISVLFGALVCGVAGYFIANTVNKSIGWD